ncbi:MAG: nuclear transport factor 2 family protein [Pseudomonadota bacterium]|nr:nuclear transport factor 2 family protein [Pseudomonadota bacterium]
MARKGKPAAARDVQLTGDKAAARAVLARREAFNRALELRALGEIADVLGEDVTLVPGDDAQPIAGRDAQLDAWQSIFANMPDVSYVRAPARIEVAEDGALAAETGRWRGAWSAEGLTIRYAGRYFAKWRHDGLAWRIEAEAFVTLKRDGGTG